jgi:hypothetical protein
MIASRNMKAANVASGPGILIIIAYFLMDLIARMTRSH